MTAVSAVTHGRVRSPCMPINAAASQRSTITAGRAQTWAINSRPSLRLFFTWYVPVIQSCQSWNERCRRRPVVRAFQIRTGQMKCVSSLSRYGRSMRCRTAQTQRQRSASANRQRVRMESLERSIRQIHSPNPIGGSTRSRNIALRWKDRASSPVPAVANTPRRQRDCAAPCCSPAQTSFCERASH